MALRQKPIHDVLGLEVHTVTIADDIAPQRWDRVKTLLSAWFPLA